MRVWIMALAAVTSCENAAGGGTAAGVDSSLVGTWVSYDSGYEIVVEFGADGSFSSSDYSMAPMASSTWSADGSTVTARMEFEMSSINVPPITISSDSSDSITIKNLLQTGTGESFEDISIKLPRKSGTGDTGVWEGDGDGLFTTLTLDTDSFTVKMSGKTTFYSVAMTTSGRRSGNNLYANKLTLVLDMYYEVNGSELKLYYMGVPHNFTKQQ